LWHMARTPRRRAQPEELVQREPVFQRARRGNGLVVRVSGCRRILDRDKFRQAAGRGDVVCGGGVWSVCTCPEECGAPACGDAICCPGLENAGSCGQDCTGGGGEDRCSCPADDTASLCGDDVGSAGEGERFSCAAD
jgi:hypothetical protein